MSVATTAQGLDLAVNMVRFHKEQRVAEAADAGGEEGDAFTAIHLFRGHEPVSLIIMPPDRDAQLAVARVATSGFDADMLSIAFETWAATLKCNPVTNRRWREGEMQDVARNHDGRAKGWIKDVVFVFVVNRAGDFAEASMPYRPDADRIHWDKPTVNYTGGGAEGFFVDQLKGIMNEVPLNVVAARLGIHPSDFGLDVDRGRDHLDCATVRFLTHEVQQSLNTTLGVTLCALPGSARAEIISRSLGDIATTYDPSDGGGDDG